MKRRKPQKKLKNTQIKLKRQKNLAIWQQPTLKLTKLRLQLKLLSKLQVIFQNYTAVILIATLEAAALEAAALAAVLEVAVLEAVQKAVQKAVLKAVLVAALVVALEMAVLEAAALEVVRKVLKVRMVRKVRMARKVRKDHKV